MQEGNQELLIKGDQTLLKQYSGNGELLAYFRNLPEVDGLYNGYCFENGARGRCNGKNTSVEPSPLCGSNILLADTRECVIIHQLNNGKGPLCVIVYTSYVDGPPPLSNKIWGIFDLYRLPYVMSDLP